MESKLVTRENMAEVAQWCGGSVEEDSEVLGLHKPFVHVDEDWLAFEGDWVVKEKQKDGTDKFDVMPDEEYQQTYRVYLQVLEIVKKMLSDRDVATYYGYPFDNIKTANDATQKILEIM